MCVTLCVLISYYTVYVGTSQQNKPAFDWFCFKEFYEICALKRITNNNLQLQEAVCVNVYDIHLKPQDSGLCSH